jgi:hypothetical protein
VWFGWVFGYKRNLGIIDDARRGVTVTKCGFLEIGISFDF